MRFQIIPIHTRLIYLTLGLLFPMLLAGFFNLWEFRNNAREQLDESLRQQAGLAATAFEQRIVAFRQTLEAVSILAENNESRYALQDYLDSIVKTRPNWVDVQIVNSGGEVVLAQSKKNSQLSPISIQPLIQEAARENAFVIATEQFGGDNLSLLTLARPIADGNFVLARIDGASVSDVFEHLKFREDNIIAVFDRNNRLLYRSRVSPEQMALDVSEAPLLAALNERREGTIEVESPYDNIARVYGLARVEATNSTVLVGVPSAKLYEPARLQFLRQLVFGLFFLILGIAAAYAIAVSITRPMGVLTEAAKRFGAGDMSARAGLEDQGAIGQLGATFDEMAEQISEREDELKELDRLKSEFVSSVSHELRTPLTTIKTLARVLQSDRLSPEERAEYLDTIAVECDRQIDFVQDLLDLSRIEAGAYRVSLGETDVIEVLIDCLKNQERTAKTRNLKLSLTNPLGPLPLAFSDEGALRRIVSGIIDNAIKYSSEGGEIMLTARMQGGRIAVGISDSGCGIAAEDLPHIFDKFYRGKPARGGDGVQNGDDSISFNEASGVGLGLYLVHTLVEQIYADIEVKSPNPGEDSGTTFTLFLPVADSAA
jgi:signal transduction histidine kinase